MRRSVVLLVLGLGCTQPAPAPVEWHQESGYRWRELQVPTRGSAGFTPLVASATGIAHTNTVDDEHALANRNLLIGAGVAAADVDGDGLIDLFFASVESPAALYRNSGNFKFADITAASGIRTNGKPTTGAAFADVDGDTDADLLIGTLGGPLMLFLNDGMGQFTDVTAGSGLEGGLAATTLALADVDRDGDLDLYVATYKVRNALDAYPPQARAFDQVVKKIGASYEVVPEWRHEFRIEDRPDLGGIVRSQRADRDLFYLNEGNGKFVPAPTSGARWRDEDGRPLAEAPDFFSLSARFADVNGDAAPDLYVCNDFEDPDQFWLNDGTGGFQLVPRLAVRATSNTCMSVAFGDVNRDGHVDFFTADMQAPTRAARQAQIPTHTPLPKVVGESPDRAQWMRNTLQLGRGDGTWAQIADFAGVASTDWTWGSAFVDVDLDGWEDLLLAVGHRWDVRDADTFDRIRNAFPRVAWNREQGEFPRLAVPSMAFRNTGRTTFEDVSGSWNFGADSAVSHGIAVADLDGDGDPDAVVTRLNAPPLVYRNETAAQRVAVRLVGRAPNTAAVGAVIEVRAPDMPVQRREVGAGGTYLSHDDAQQMFAAPRTGTVDITVRWPDGKTGELRGVTAGRLYLIDQITLPESSKPVPPVVAPLFEDATSLLGGHRHVETLFDDFRRQPGLPNRMSQLGPGLSWIDVNGDGREDLVVPSGLGGRLAIFTNTGNGFRRADAVAAAGDQGTALPAPGGGLLLSQSNYESSSESAALQLPGVVRVTGAAGSTVTTVVPGDTASMGPLALGDVNGDGVLDLFVGARLRPGAWPLPARSRLYRGVSGGGFEASAELDADVRALGQVTSAMFADINGDGRPDLIAAAEWGPIRVLLNTNGRLQDATERLGLSETSSRWFGVNAGDFDGDGKLDIVATSWGRNVPWRASVAHPHALWIARDSARLVLLSAEYDPRVKKEMPLESFALLGTTLPDVRRRIHSYAEYASTDVATVLGPLAASAVRVGATTFDHTVFLNRGGSFERRSLPDETQMAPAVAPVVADFDGDGREDLFLSQNFYPTEIGTMRFDAGAGQLLLGDGKGGFTNAANSGIRVLGDGRGAAASDYDQDGRVDLAVAQNGAPTRLFHNTRGRPGVRVSLDAGAGNPWGVGTQVRLLGAAGMGPVREVRAGAGYWSMDGAMTILGRSEKADSIWVRWPGGEEERRIIGVGWHMTLSKRALQFKKE